MQFHVIYLKSNNNNNRKICVFTYSITFNLYENMELLPTCRNIDK